MKQIKRNGVEISVEDEYTLVEGEELVEKTEEEEKQEVVENTSKADDTLDVPPEE